MNTLWKDGVVFAESAAFVMRPTARTVFPAAEILAVRNPTLGIEYEAGRDYEFRPESGGIVRTEQSRIPTLNRGDLYPDKETAVFFPAEGANALPGGPDGGLIRFDQGDFFARHQVEIDYRTEAELPELCAVPFPDLSGRSVKLAFLGDSITAGFNSTARLQVPPFAPPYATRLAEALRETKADLVWRNFAVGGTGCAHGAEHLDEFLAEFLPDWLVIAYGMNDLKNYPAEEFAARIDALARDARKRNPAMKVFTVAAMPGNAEWEHVPPENARAFAAALRKLEYPCIDVNTPWEKLFRNKSFIELTGNGVNHPNDYTYRFYAAVAEDRFRKELRHGA